MLKIASLGVLLTASAGAEPRIAVHPLEVGSATRTQREQLQAQFDVMLARTEGIKLAGSSRIEEALQTSAGTRCEVRDSCLRFLAETTDCLYGMYVRVDSHGDLMVVVARVVRVDGLVVRKVQVPLRAQGKATLVELARQALAQALLELKLDGLDSTLPVDTQPPEPMTGFTPPPAPPLVVEPAAPPARLVVVSAEPSPVNWRRVTGVTLIGVGGVTFIAGGVFAGLAAAGTAANPPDAAGLVAPERAAPVAAALRQSSIAAILLPTGAAVAAIGAIVVLLPRSDAAPVGLSVAPMRDGLTVSISGHFQ